MRALLHGAPRVFDSVFTVAWILALMPTRRPRLALVRMNSMRAVYEQPAAQPLTTQPVA